MYGRTWKAQPAAWFGGPVHGLPVGCPPTTGPSLNEFTTLPARVYWTTQPFWPHSDAGMYDGRDDGSALHHVYQPALGNRPLVSWKLWIARPSCFRLLLHWTRAAASRTFCTAGKSRPMRMAMIAITTKSSISVNPRRGRSGRVVMGSFSGTRKMTEPRGGRGLGTGRACWRGQCLY